MHQLTQLDKPNLPDNWDYEKSVSNVKQQIYKWKNLTQEIAQELHIANKILTNRERASNGTFITMDKTWSEYCQEIGSSKQVVNRWLKQWFPPSKKIIEIEYQSDTCTISDLYTLIDQGKKFGTIYSDPPWSYSNQATRASTDNHYQTLTPQQIAEYPVSQLTSEKAHLHLWTTNAFLFECPQIMEAWGFEYKGVFLWIKPQMGIGNYWRVSHEFLLLGVKGGLTFHDHNHMSWIIEERTRHSSKPESIAQLIEKVSPAPYLELFARSPRVGWVVHGNEIERTLFTEAALG